jgi:UDP-N-acetylglucosamine transferase subunit ALG13
MPRLPLEGEPLGNQLVAAGGGATLLVASTGGHLEELVRLSHRFTPRSARVEWVTFADPQSESLLAGKRVHTVPYIPPRGYVAAASSLARAVSILRRGKFDRIVSTGAGIAIPFLTAARILGVESHYIESSARTGGASVTGSVVSRLPGVRTYTQHRAWSSPRWRYEGSLFDGYEVIRAPDGIRAPVAGRVVVTLGTMRTYGFRRAVDRLRLVLPQVTTADADVLWQVGATEVDDLQIQVRDRIPASEMLEAIGAADLVIAHAGIGSALSALDAGVCPVLLPRSAAHKEHVDDHQRLIARDLNERGLAISRDVDKLNAGDLTEAMARSIHGLTTAAPFMLSSPERS